METYINKKVNDITYQSELILDIFDVKDLIRPSLRSRTRLDDPKRSEGSRAYNLRRTFVLRKLCTH